MDFTLGCADENQSQSIDDGDSCWVLWLESDFLFNFK